MIAAWLVIVLVCAHGDAYKVEGGRVEIIAAPAERTIPVARQAVMYP